MNTTGKWLASSSLNKTVPKTFKSQIIRCLLELQLAQLWVERINFLLSTVFTLPRPCSWKIKMMLIWFWKNYISNCNEYERKENKLNHHFDLRNCLIYFLINVYFIWGLNSVNGWVIYEPINHSIKLYNNVIFVNI